jgi:class 3 adenylate cyclase
MIDRPDRKVSRFPATLESSVALEISNRIDKLKPGFGFASAACGSDILFLEAMLEHGAEISIVLPYNEEEFLRDSVDFLPESDWGARFRRVRDKAARVITASAQRLEIGGVSYEFCNDLILGLATIRAHRLGADLVSLAVWDGMGGDGPGGAASAVQDWRSRGYEPEIIELATLAGGATLRGAEELVGSHLAGSGQAESSPTESNAFGSRIVAMLFADAVGFSKLTEPEVPRFVEHFLGAIAGLSKKFQEAILHKNTWGDGLYFVFGDVDLAGKFALDLADLVASTKWEEKGLRPGLSLRIGLHAGPVYEFNDPITETRSYSGTHVSRAARIEPITPPGQVYASESFAALAAAQRTNYFTCDYVGQTPMAKSYGTLPTYHVRFRARSQRL